MDESDVAAAIAEFFESLDDLALEKTYPYPISQTTGKLPDVVVFVNDAADTLEPPPEFPGFDFQEGWWRIFQVTCSFMVQVAEQTEAAAEDAWHTIEGMVATLREAIGSDLSLGGRFLTDSTASPLLHFDFSEPFVNREDQTTGRGFVLDLRVGERIPAPEGAGPN